MSIPTVSTRANNTPSSAVRKLVPWAMEAQKRGIKIYHVNIGQPDIPTPKPIISAIRNYMGPILDYAPSPGLAQTIEAWQIFYKDKNLFSTTTPAVALDELRRAQPTFEWTIVTKDVVKRTLSERRCAAFSAARLRC